MTESDQRTVFWIPEGEDAFVANCGWRVSFVTEDEPGHAPTGTWPYTGAVGETRPYFFGHDYTEALERCYVQNDRLGISREETDLIVLSSIAAQMKKARS